MRFEGKFKLKSRITFSFTKPRVSLAYTRNQDTNDRGLICTLVRAFPCARIIDRPTVECVRDIRVIGLRNDNPCAPD